MSKLACEGSKTHTHSLVKSEFILKGDLVFSLAYLLISFSHKISKSYILFSFMTLAFMHFSTSKL